QLFISWRYCDETVVESHNKDMSGPDFLSPLRPGEVPAKLDELWKGAEECHVIFFPQQDGSLVNLERVGSSVKMCVASKPGDTPIIFHIKHDGTIAWNREATGANPYLILKNLEVTVRTMDPVPGAR